MEDRFMNKKKVILFVVITYAIAWTLQIIGSVFLINNPGQTGTLVFQISLAVCMYAPLLAALAVRADFKGMGWKPKFKGNIGWLFLSAYAALPLALIGGALFYMIFPDLFDLTGSTLVVQGEQNGVDLMAQLAEQGLDYKTYLVISLVPSVVFAPFFNIITAIGEEAGWRGFLYPELGKRFGKVAVWIIGGILWAAFHFPAMLIGGYEYGYNYIGSPWLGLIVFTLFCIAAGILENVVYEKTKSIWYPALLHGSINAMLTIPPVFENAYATESLEKYAVFGPFGTGLIAALPLILFSLIIGIVFVIKNRKTEVTA